MSMYTQMLDEFPMRNDTELQKIKKSAAVMCGCCIGLFGTVLMLSWALWQSIENEKAINLENVALRVKISALEGSK